MNPLFQILHGSQFLLTCWLVGYFFFHNWIARPVGSARQATPETNLRGCRLLLGSLLTISILWFLCVTFEMAESLGPADIWMAIQSTSFGHISCFQISLLLILLFFSYTQFFSRAGWLVFLLPFSLSLSGHAGADPSHLLLNLTLDTIHVVSVSIWTGGLVALYLFLRNYLSYSEYRNGTSHLVVQRFSKFAMLSTFLITVTGVWASLRAGLTPWSIFKTTYGILILTKIALFGMTLLVASVNQFLHLGRWDPKHEPEFVKNVQREVGIEIILVILIFGVAGFLTRQALPMQ